MASASMGLVPLLSKMGTSMMVTSITGCSTAKASLHGLMALYTKGSLPIIGSPAREYIHGLMAVCMRERSKMDSGMGQVCIRSTMQPMRESGKRAKSRGRGK